MAKKTNKKIVKLSTKKKVLKKKVAKKKTVKKYIHPDNRSGDPKFNVLIGKIFYWEEPWSEWEPEEIECLDESLLDEDGNPPNELCGDWLITSVNADGDSVWLNFVPTDGDQQMEFPISLLPEFVWD
jgi:hypothetical protein